MEGFKVTKIDDIPPYQGPKAIAGIRFRPAGRELGVTSWGMNVLSIDAGCPAYPQHDHTHDGQEEVYVVLQGDGSIETAGKKTDIGAGSMIRVGPSTVRKISPGPNGIVVLAIGGIPGKAYSSG